MLIELLTNRGCGLQFRLGVEPLGSNMIPFGSDGAELGARRFKLAFGFFGTLSGAIDFGQPTRLSRAIALLELHTLRLMSGRGDIESPSKIGR